MWSSPAIGSDGTIYVGSGDDYIYAINPDGTLKWKYQARYHVSSSPAIGSDGTIYVGSGDDYIYAINPNGTLKWKYQTGDVVYSSPAIGSDGTIYVGSDDDCLYAIKPDGTLKWGYKTRAYVDSSPAIGSDGTIYVGSQDGYIYALSPPRVPSVPQNLRATAGDGYVLLRWNAPADDGGSSITEYKIYRGTSSGGETYLASVSASSTSYNDTDVTNGKICWYYVTAMNSGGESQPSNEISATQTSAASAPQNLSMLWLFGIIAIIMGIVSVLIVMWGRKKRNESRMVPMDQQYYTQTGQHSQIHTQSSPQQYPPQQPQPNYEHPPPPPSQSSEPLKTDITERLSKLSELKEKGLITDEEFQRKKEELLKKL